MIYKSTPCRKFKEKSTSKTRGIFFFLKSVLKKHGKIRVGRKQRKTISFSLAIGLIVTTPVLRCVFYIHWTSTNLYTSFRVNKNALYTQVVELSVRNKQNYTHNLNEHRGGTKLSRHLPMSGGYFCLQWCFQAWLGYYVRLYTPQFLLFTSCSTCFFFFSQ